MRPSAPKWAALLLSTTVAASAHDVITTAITFNREISRIIYDKCASCHRDGGTAFSLLTYNQARPWAVAIKEEVLRRRMPPWGAVKGFGAFRNDQSLTSEQLEMIISWVDGGVPEGEDKDLQAPPKFKPETPFKVPKTAIPVAGDYKLTRKFSLDGFYAKTVPPKSSIQITAELPDGSVEPLLWLDGFRSEFNHPYLLRPPLDLPAGTMIRGVPPGASLLLLPATP